MSLENPTPEQLEILKRFELPDEEWARDIIWLKKMDATDNPGLQAKAERVFSSTIESQGLGSKKSGKYLLIAESHNVWESQKLVEPVSTNFRRPCPGPFKTPAVMWDGTLTICCFDGMMEYALGNLKDRGFKELWYGERANQIRLYHIRGEFERILTRDGLPKCLYCRGYDTPQISDGEIEAFLKSQGLEQEFEKYKSRVSTEKHK